MNCISWDKNISLSIMLIKVRLRVTDSGRLPTRIPSKRKEKPKDGRKSLKGKVVFGRRE